MPRPDRHPRARGGASRRRRGSAALVALASLVAATAIAFLFAARAQPPQAARALPRIPVADSARAYRLLASAYGAVRAARYDSAIAAFRAALALTPERSDVRKDLAYTYFKAGENELARREFEEVVRRDSSDAWAALELAFLDYDSPETANKADAYRLFRALRASRDTAVRARAAAAFANVDRALEARLAQWADAVRKEPGNAYFTINYGRAAEERDEPAVAESYYARSLTSEFPALWLDLARLRRRLGRHAAADSALRRAAASANPFVAEAARDAMAAPGAPGAAAAPAARGASPAGASGARPLGAGLAAGTYHVVGDTAGGWGALLGASGYQPGERARAQVVVLRAGADPAAVDWELAARDGQVLVLEGPSRVAELFGFATTAAGAAGAAGAVESVEARREVDPRRPDQMILWERPARVPRATVPPRAAVFSRERWAGVPLMAGYRVGRGAVLWTAAPLGRSGFERFPYLPEALAELGAPPAVRGRALQLFLDWSYRTRADPAYLARRWRDLGARTVHVSAWYFHERDPARDRYLATLIDEAHKNGILVYAWLEFPHVSEQFWAAHPEWRERNALLQDAAIYWRKNMNLLNEQAFAAAAAGVRDLLARFDWDGANLSELYFEGPRGLADLSEFTPLSDDVRREVRARHGFDPAELFRAGSPTHHARAPERLRQFYEYRVDLQYRLHVKMLDLLADVRRAKGGSFGIAVCYLDDVFEPSMRELIGADARRLLPLMERYDFEFIVQDPSVLWGLGPERYARMAEKYAALTPRVDRLSVDINIVARPSISFPTLHQTGTELLQLVHTVARAFPTVTLYAENSILSPDVPLVPAAAAVVTGYEARGDSVVVDSPRGVGVRWSGPALVDGRAWAHQDSGAVWLPAGRHVVRPSRVPPHTRLADFNGTLRRLALTPNGLTLSYDAGARAIAVLDRAPLAVRVDGRPAAPRVLRDGAYAAVLLPGGSHDVEIVTRR